MIYDIIRRWFVAPSSTREGIEECYYVRTASVEDRSQDSNVRCSQERQRRRRLRGGVEEEVVASGRYLCSVAPALRRNRYPTEGAARPRGPFSVQIGLGASTSFVAESSSPGLSLRGRGRNTPSKNEKKNSQKTSYTEA